MELYSESGLTVMAMLLLLCVLPVSCGEMMRYTCGNSEMGSESRNTTTQPQASGSVCIPLELAIATGRTGMMLPPVCHRAISDVKCYLYDFMTDYETHAHWANLLISAVRASMETAVCKAVVESYICNYLYPGCNTVTEQPQGICEESCIALFHICSANLIAQLFTVIPPNRDCTNTLNYLYAFGLNFTTNQSDCILLNLPPTEPTNVTGLSQQQLATVAGTTAVLVVMVMLLFAGVFVVACKRCNHKRQHMPKNTTTPATYCYNSPLLRRRPPQHLSSLCQNVSTKMTTDFAWEVDYSTLHLEGRLGTGAFGTVYKATFQCPVQGENITVAVKVLKDGAPDFEHQALLSEIQLMKQLDFHPHVVRMLACCTQGTSVAMVMDFFSNGNLRDFLVKSRNGSEGSSPEMDTPPAATTSNPPLTLHALLCFARQIAMGMEYLSQQRIVHRDLAARNVFVDEELKVRVGDFGLSRDVYEELFYKAHGGKLPLRWMSVEAITYRQFSTKSDVWSFGIVIWELITLGAYPYPELGNSEVLPNLKNGYRMPQPEDCPEELYNLMILCWAEKPRDRPSFSRCRESIDTIIASTEEAEEYLDLQVP